MAMDTFDNVPCLIQRDPPFLLFLFKNSYSKMAAGPREFGEIH